MKKKMILLFAISCVLFCSFGCRPDMDKHADQTTLPVTEEHSVLTTFERTTHYTSPDYTYYFKNGEIKLKGYLGDKINVTIPSEIDGHRVTVLGEDSFYQRTEVKSVTIPSSVNEIEDGAFYRCYSLEKAYIPKGVTKIGSNPYFRCDSLKEIKVDPKNPNYCDVDGVLFNKDKTILVSYPEARRAGTYHIPDGVIEIEDDAFGYEPSIEKVYIPKSVIIFPTNRLSAQDPKDLILVVEKGSAAETFAKENNLRYEVKE